MITSDFNLEISIQKIIHILGLLEGLDTHLEVVHSDPAVASIHEKIRSLTLDQYQLLTAELRSVVHEMVKK